MSVKAFFVAVWVFLPIFCAMLFLFATLLLNIHVLSSLDDGLYLIEEVFFSFYGSAIPTLNRL